MEIQVKDIECEKCNEKFESIDKLIDHVMEIEHETKMECLDYLLEKDAHQRRENNLGENLICPEDGTKRE